MPAWDVLFTKGFKLCNDKLKTNVINSLKMQTKKKRKINKLVIYRTMLFTLESNGEVNNIVSYLEY